MGANLRPPTPGCVLVAICVLSILAPAAIGKPNAQEDCITKDIAIIGGGASGAYAAVRLRENFDKSVILIEKRDHLGGHVDTFADASSTPPVPYDYGVQAYIEYGNARAFFTRFNVSTGNPTRLFTAPKYMDFTTGEAVEYTAPDFNSSAQALATYLGLCEEYEDIMFPGFFNFPRGDQIPDDLLLSFGDFVAKYGIEAALPTIFPSTGLGTGNMLSQTTLAVMQAFGTPMGRALNGEWPLFVPASLNNSELYGQVSKSLGKDVLYSTTVSESERSTDGVELVVKGTDGTATTIRAKRLLVAMEPTVQNMEPLHMDEDELSVFSKGQYSTIYGGIVTHPSLPVNFSVVNTPAAASPANYVFYPQVPFVDRFDYIGGAAEPLFRVLMIGDTTLTPEDAKELVQNDFARLVKAGTLPKADQGDELTWKAFSDHGAMHLRVSAEELRKDFIRDMYALQGQRSTWYTGGAWAAQFTTSIWAFTDVVLPELVKGM